MWYESAVGLRFWCICVCASDFSFTFTLFTRIHRRDREDFRSNWNAKFKTMLISNVYGLYNFQIFATSNAILTDYMYLNVICLTLASSMCIWCVYIMSSVATPHAAYIRTYIRQAHTHHTTYKIYEYKCTLIHIETAFSFTLWKLSGKNWIDILIRCRRRRCCCCCRCGRFM